MLTTNIACLLLLPFLATAGLVPLAVILPALLGLAVTPALAAHVNNPTCSWKVTNGSPENSGYDCEL